MRSTKTIQVISCHAEGEVGDVITGGVAPPPGNTIWEQRTFIEKDETLRNFVLNEPRGGVFKHVNLLVPPKHPDADAAFIIMEPEDTPPMSGSNSICVSTVLLDAGIIPMQEPVTNMTLEAPGGLVEVIARCKNGKAETISVQNLPSFADKLNVPLEVEVEPHGHPERREVEVLHGIVTATLDDDAEPRRRLLLGEVIMDGRVDKLLFLLSRGEERYYVCYGDGWKGYGVPRIRQRHVHV